MNTQPAKFTFIARKMVTKPRQRRIVLFSTYGKTLEVIDRVENSVTKWVENEAQIHYASPVELFFTSEHLEAVDTIEIVWSKIDV